MKLVVFSKMFKTQSVDDLAAILGQLGVDGCELCLRPGYRIHSGNADTMLAEAARRFRERGLSIPLLSGGSDLLAPDHPAAEKILSAMDEADIRMLKLGYFRFVPSTQHYWREVDRIRGILAGWGELAEKHRVKIVYHTHSGGFMGGNAAALAHLLRGFDPRYIGAYLDPAHMVIEGEAFAAGLSMLKEYVCAVGLKDVLVERREAGGHGDLQAVFKPAGQGMVNWSAVFAELKHMRFAGVLSIHCQHAGKAEVIRELKDEADFFRQWVEKDNR